ncbi:hypothetical protein HWQ46_25440, partial [Shewanella sp. D64]
GETRTCRNNCTDSISSRPKIEMSDTTLRYLASHGVEHPHSLELLANGLRVFTDEGKVWWFSDGQLQFERLVDAENSEFEFF